MKTVQRFRKSFRFNSSHWVYPAYILALLAVWQLYIYFANPPKFILPAPVEVAQAFVQASGSGILWGNFLYTLGNIIIGFFSGLLVGIVMGYLLWKSAIVHTFFDPYITAFQAIPKIAIAPLLVLWFGLGNISQLALILVMAFFPIMVAMREGLTQVKCGYRDLATIYDLSPWEYFRQIQLYACLPHLFAGAKIALLDAMTGAFLSEFITAKRGLGYVMVFGNSSFNSALLFVAILSTVFLGLVGYGVIALLENRLLWKE